MSYAQLQEGVKSIGADGMLASQGNTYGSNAISAMVYPDFGYFIRDNLESGFRVGADFFYIWDRTRFRYNSLTLSMGLFTKKYIPMDNGKFGFFINQQVQWERFSSYHFTPAENHVLRLSINPGAYFFLNERNIFEFTFSDLYISQVLETKYIFYGLNLTNASFKIGIRHFFNFAQPKINATKRTSYR